MSSFLLCPLLPGCGAELPSGQHYLSIPGAAAHDGREPGLGEKKISGWKTSVAEGERKTALEMLQAAGTDRHCLTFVLYQEDHRLGNSLRYMIMKNPEVAFCGYTRTHPSESKINLHIYSVIQKGLNELVNVWQQVLDKREASIKDYKDQKPSRNEHTF
uniref:DNA-directed RNA polymerases I and III subunit RPAC2 n=1 Tax=Jaculus jaculus TaxID=51337 RepID=A0A8C5LCV3_JACJA